MTNARLFGLFRGKLGNVTGNSVAELNSIPCHGTTEGVLDLNLDGSRVDDAFAH
jgi:hypothetical protein